ncbi:MAG: Ppx/GppA family phosphatase [Gammaproteobacteria bacterium]|nr:Ppx/GppA family phosphatase [Gammaproteobacteria bacterium]
MLVAREDSGRLQILDRLREPVRLAAGLGADGGLAADAQNRALACLSRFGQRLRGIPPARVRVVGTNTLRKLNDGGMFVATAENALGHSIEVVSGLEEARLVYAGVVRDLDGAPPRRLVVDIGGGSTELIIGRNGQSRMMESVGVGCVSHTLAFFGDGQITRGRMQEARLAARVQMEFLQRRFRRAGWDYAIGASGTVRGAWRVMRAQGWCNDTITAQALERTLALTVAVGQVRKLDLPGLREDRRPVFPGGLAVLAAVFDMLQLEELATSEAALREGVIYDLLGRLHDRDVRGDTVTGLAQRYGVDRRQAADVERTALRLLDAVAVPWELERDGAARLLSWAARLHEIGLAIAHDGYPKHAEYLLRNGDLPGFSLTEQRQLAALVRLQRGRPSRAVLEDLPPAQRTVLARLAAVFRLAVLLHRSRTPRLRLPVSLCADGKRLRVGLPARWLARHPLTRADLRLERGHIVALGVKLAVEETA